MRSRRQCSAAPASASASPSSSGSSQAAPTFDAWLPVPLDPKLLRRCIACNWLLPNMGLHEQRCQPQASSRCSRKRVRGSAPGSRGRVLLHDDLEASNHLGMQLDCREQAVRCATRQHREEPGKRCHAHGADTSRHALAPLRVRASPLPSTTPTPHHTPPHQSHTHTHTHTHTVHTHTAHPTRRRCPGS